MSKNRLRAILIIVLMSGVSLSKSFAQGETSPKEETTPSKLEQLETTVDNLSSTVKKLNKFKFSGYIQT
ncbi:MAG: hypothetical protein FWF70_00065, partial [Bacteroidetes bacterium]|nr:hypothetical protein [Bacteroidota bacterium]